jgi:putative hydrolase of the HAD superfamily
MNKLELVIFDFFGVIYRNEEIDNQLLDLIKKIKKELNVKVVVLSNVKKEKFVLNFKDIMTNGPIDEFYFSSEIGFKKPAEEAFKHVLENENIEVPNNVIFFDDTEANVEGAKKLGIYTKLYVNPETVKYTFKELFDLDL